MKFKVREVNKNFHKLGVMKKIDEFLGDDIWIDKMKREFHVKIAKKGCMLVFGQTSRHSYPNGNSKCEMYRTNLEGFSA